MHKYREEMANVKSVRFTFYNNGGRGKFDLRRVRRALQLTNKLPVTPKPNTPALQVVIAAKSWMEMVVRGPESPDPWEGLPATPSPTKRLVRYSDERGREDEDVPQRPKEPEAIMPRDETLTPLDLPEELVRALKQPGKRRCYNMMLWAFRTGHRWLRKEYAWLLPTKDEKTGKRNFTKSEVFNLYDTSWTIAGWEEYSKDIFEAEREEDYTLRAAGRVRGIEGGEGRQYSRA